MCGIFGFVGDTQAHKLNEGLEAMRHRGPDACGVTILPLDGGNDAVLGHTRLAIIDPENRDADQPFTYGDVTLAFNGEIWNYRELRRELEDGGRFFATESDTEVLAAALDEWGQEALPKLQGMFAAAWTPDRGEHVYLARDRFGEVPLHYTRWGTWASEIKGLYAMTPNLPPAEVMWVQPGQVVEMSDNRIRLRHWYRHEYLPKDNLTNEEAARQLREHLENGTMERTISDVPVCTLLSGGIDSAAVAHFASKATPGLVAYTAVFDRNSRDLRCSRLVAEQLGIDLVEVAVPSPGVDDLRRVVRIIEQPHKAQVEIGWACLKLAERIHDDGTKVVLSGEGSDELWASYGNSYFGIRDKGWFDYRTELFVGQHRKNFARCNKIFMAHSIECRLPFLNTGLVEFALSLPQDQVAEPGRPKIIMERALANLLPEKVLRRPKVAFQDGMGLKKAIAEVVADPKRVYKSEFAEAYQGAKA